MFGRMVGSTAAVHSGSGQQVTDGSDLAPAGVSPQYPNMLNGYQVARRPTWNVAGVHYGVGYPAATSLQDPADISMSGVSVNTSGATVTITGNNVTLDGYDFSLSNGWGVSIEGSATNTTIKNSKFLVGTRNQSPIFGHNTTSTLYVGYCVIDGAARDDSVSCAVRMDGSNLTVEYCWIKDPFSDHIQHHGGGTLIIRNNLLQNGSRGSAQGAHGDYLQIIGGPFSVTITYNTCYQQTDGSQGLMLEPDFGQTAGVITSGEYSHNVMISEAPDGWMSYWGAITCPDIVNTVTVHDNHFDYRTGFGWFVGGIRGGADDGYPKTIFTDNINMSDGSVYEDS